MDKQKKPFDLERQFNGDMTTLAVEFKNWHTPTTKPQNNKKLCTENFQTLPELIDSSEINTQYNNFVIM